MLIRHRSSAQGLIVELDGELDLASAPALERELRSAQADATSRITVALSNPRFMDCSGLNVLLTAHRRSREANRGFSLAPGPRQVQRIFELTGTLAAFSFEPRRL